MIYIQKPDGTVLTWVDKVDMFIRWERIQLMIEMDRAILGLPSIFGNFFNNHTYSDNKTMQKT